MSSIPHSVVPLQAHLGNSFRTVASTACSWWVAYMNWRLERFAIRRLRSLSDRELKDIGIQRSSIESVVRGLDRHPMFDATH